MMKLNMFFTLLSSIILLSSGTGRGTIDNNRPVKFRVYQHTFLSGQNVSVYEVAQAAITATSPTFFGLLRVGDILITSGPDMSTGMLGRLEGLVAYTGLTEASAVSHLEFLFTEGKYKGSSISLLGRRTVAGLREEVPIAGGTGKFLAARGYTLSSTYSYDPTIDYAIFRHDFYIYPN